MSNKNKDRIDSLLKQKTQEIVEESEKTVDKSLDNVVYSVSQKVVNGSREYYLTKLKYDIDTKSAIVENYVRLDEKVIGMRFPIDQQHLQYYYDKSKKLGDN